jgi:acyl-CoA reductase-like NAD-dependent aldehyde dehydrogenase
VEAAVEAARGAFTGAWAKTSPAKRARMLTRLAQLIDERTDELAELESRNVGKAKWQCASEIKVAVATLELFAGTAQHLYGRSHVVNPAVVTYTLREPVGVVGAIIPWNYPFMMAAWKVAPALATGNTMVLKPASATPLTALRLGELALEAGIPAGVLNVVPGPGAEVGEAIAAHPGIDKVAFTGETATGRRIAQVAAGSLKRVSLELGGKSPNIVFADADLDAAVLGSLWAIYYAAGQSCEARSRIFVEEPAYDAFAGAFAERARGLRVGDPLADDTKVGSLISPQHADRVRGYIESGIQEGGELLAGGELSLEDGLDPSAFVAPTVIGGVDNGARVAQEEIFGPVVTLTRFADEAEAVRLANDVRYGLAATVWTGDGARGHRMAQRIRSGAIGINTPFVAFPGVPFGGFKESGYGREQSLEAIDLYTETKAVLQNTSPKPINPLGI